MADESLNREAVLAQSRNRFAILALRMFYTACAWRG